MIANSDGPISSAALDGDLFDTIPVNGAPVWRIWRTDKCLVVPAAEARLPGFATAAEHMAARGWPLRTRRSGGLAVPNGPGLLNLSVGLSCQGAPPLRRGYDLLLDALAQTLARFGITASSGAVAGAFCDGRYNLVVAGRKLAGTAQHWKTREHQLLVLAHALILGNIDISEAVHALEDYYRALGRARQFSVAAMIDLAKLGIEEQAFEQALSEQISSAHAGKARARYGGPPDRDVSSGP